MIAMLAGATMWGLTWWPMRVLRDTGIDPVALTLLSTGAAALALLPFALPQWRTLRLHPGALAIIAIFGGYANLSYTVAMVYGNPIRMMMLFYLAPIWALIGARVFLHEMLDWVRVVAVALAVLGALLTLGGPSLLQQAPALIDLLAISAGFSYAMSNLAYRHSHGVPVATKNTANFLGACVASLVVWPFVDVPAGALSAHPWLGIAFGLLWYLPAVGLTQYGVSHMPAVRSAILLTLELPIAAVTSWLIVGMVLSPMEMVGGALILAAALLETAPRRGSTPEHLSRAA
jgi:drug/metabolite transporter (DMT)-like permease